MRAAMDGEDARKTIPGHEATRGKPEGEGPLRCRCALHSLPLTAIPGPALGRNKILSRHVVDKRMIVLAHMHLGVMLAQRPDLTPEAKAFTSLAGETQVGRARADLC